MNRPARGGLLLLLAVMMVVAGPVRVANATPTNTLSAIDQAKSFAYYKALRACMAMGYYKDFGGINPALVTHMSQQNAIDFEWFNGRAGTGGTATNGINVGAFNDPRGTSGDGSQNCGDSEGKAWIRVAATLWGYSGTSSDGPNLLCQLKFTREQKGVDCNDTTPGANDDFIAPGDLAGYLTKGPSNLDDFWKGWLESGSTDIGSITPNGGAYRLYLDNLKSQCRLSPGGNDYTIQEFPNGSKDPVPTKYGAADRDRGPGYKVTIYDGMQMSCRDIANQISDPNSDVVTGYINFLRSGSSDKPSGGGDTCPQADPAKCQSGQSTCRINGIGWILCPTINFLAGVADTAYKFLADNFLSVPPRLFDTGSPTFQAWSSFLGIANVILVITFVVIIYSQLTGVGVNNYGIKKLLPRLIFVAIAMNLSYFICQAAVDLSNILGYSLKDLLTGIVKFKPAIDAATPGTVAPASATGSDWTGIAGTALLAGTAAGVGVAAAGGVTLAVVALIAALVGVVVTLILIFFVLVLREVLVVLLVVIAPLAFVAYLLPNTSSWFERWRKLFFQLLLVFPVIGLIYGASALASKVITETYKDTGNGIAQIVGGAVLILPLLLVPVVLKGAINGIGKFAGMINSVGGKLSGGAQKGLVGAYKGTDWNKFRENRKADRSLRMRTGTYRGAGGSWNPRNWVSRTNRALNDNTVFNKATGGFGAERQLTAQAQERKDLKDAIDMFGNDDFLIEAWAATGGDLAAANVWRAPDGTALSAAQLKQFERMRGAGHHLKATSHMAAVTAMAESGKGSTTALVAALGHAQAAGASQTEIDGAWQAALASYRKAGRGDIVGEMNAQFAANGHQAPLSTASMSATPPALALARQTAWTQVAPQAVHREGIGTGNPTGRTSYETYLNADPENTRSALTGFDAMEARARAQAQGLIVAAAQAHQYTATGVTPTISNIQDAKSYFGVK